jgi:hypothetical protein
MGSRESKHWHIKQRSHQTRFLWVYWNFQSTKFDSSISTLVLVKKIINTTVFAAEVEVVVGRLTIDQENSYSRQLVPVMKMYFATKANDSR